MILAESLRNRDVDDIFWDINIFDAFLRAFSVALL